MHLFYDTKVAFQFNFLVKKNHYHQIIILYVPLTPLFLFNHITQNLPITAKQKQDTRLSCNLVSNI